MRIQKFFAKKFVILIDTRFSVGAVLCFVLLVFAGGCKSKDPIFAEQDALLSIWQSAQGEADTGAKRFSVANKIAANYIEMHKPEEAVLFLLDTIDKNPKDEYNGYYLFMVAFAYTKMNAQPVSEYYFAKVLQDYDDLLVKGESIHRICLQNLVKVDSPQRRIKYFDALIARFPEQVNIAELYLRRAIEYEKISEWDDALKSYSLFLQQPDSASIQIPDSPGAFKRAKLLVGYSKSNKDWTFSTLGELSSAVKTAIGKYDWRALDRYKAKVNFFSMSWKQDEFDANAQEEFSMRGFMRGNQIHCAAKVDSDPGSNEAYLRTWGWSQYVSVWYLYFRKVNYPIDPDINGNWEWAGIYMGEKM